MDPDGSRDDTNGYEVHLIGMESTMGMGPTMRCLLALLAIWIQEFTATILDRNWSQDFSPGAIFGTQY